MAMLNNQMVIWNHLAKVLHLSGLLVGPRSPAGPAPGPWAPAFPAPLNARASAAWEAPGVPWRHDRGRLSVEQTLCFPMFSQFFWGNSSTINSTTIFFPCLPWFWHRMGLVQTQARRPGRRCRAQSTPLARTGAAGVPRLARAVVGASRREHQAPGEDPAVLCYGRVQW